MLDYLSKINLKNFSEKTCLLRVDLNIEPKEEKNAYRLEAILPTIKLLLKNKIKVVILSHRGQPQKIPNFKSQISKFTLSPFSSIISQKIKQPVVFFPHFDFKKIKKQIQNSQNQIFLLENLRFLKGEEKNDSKLSRQLAQLADFYINDAFAVSHRKNASVVAISKYLPSYAGLLLEKEIKNLDKVIKNYKHPLTIIIGGAKISDKIGVIKYLWRKADYFLLGGGPANTFFYAQGLPIGDSLAEKNLSLKNYLNSKKIILPSDCKISQRKILDIGPQTIKKFSEIIKKSKTIIWNGPMGMFEKKEYKNGTFGIWKAILANRKAQIVIGGGETLASLATLMPADYKRITTDTYQRKSASNISVNPRLFLSTGGGAMLEYLSGKKLPGIEALAL